MKATFWRTKLDEVNDTIKALGDRHVRLKEDYNKLSDKYSATKACVLDSVWRYIPQHCIAFENIPKLDTQLVETSLNVGEWNIFDNLGSGQFSVVKRCRRSAGTGCDADKEYAIKMICKDKYRTVDSIFRAENEVKALTVLGCHPNILAAEHILHGRIGLYIVTEIMPMDLFDFTEKFKYHLNDKLVGYVMPPPSLLPLPLPLPLLPVVSVSVIHIPTTFLRNSHFIHNPQTSAPTTPSLYRPPHTIQIRSVSAAGRSGPPLAE